MIEKQIFLKENIKDFQLAIEQKRLLHHRLILHFDSQSVKCNKHFSDFQQFKSAADNIIPGLPSLGGGLMSFLGKSNSKSENIQIILQRLIRIANNTTSIKSKAIRNLLFNFFNIQPIQSSRKVLTQYIKDKVVKHKNRQQEPQVINLLYSFGNGPYQRATAQINNSLILWSSPHIMYPLIGANIQLNHLPNIFIQIYHSADIVPLNLQLILNQQKQQQIFQKYLQFYTCIKKRAGQALKCQGKMFIKVNEIQAEQGKLVIQLPQRQIKIKTKQVKTPFQLYLPVFDLNDICIFYLQENDKSIMKNHQKQEEKIHISFHTIYRQLQFLNQPAVCQKTILLHHNRALSLSCSIFNNMDTMFFSAPDQKSTNQTNTLIDEFQKKEFKLHLKRLKRLFIILNQFIKPIKSMINFRYMILSHMFYLLFIFSIWFINLNECLFYFTFLLILFILYFQPTIRLTTVIFKKYLQKRWPLVQIILFKLFQKRRQQSSLRQLKEVENQKFLNKFDMQYTSSQKSLVQKFRKLRKYLIILQNIFNQCADLIQKIKNLFSWKYPRRSAILLIILIIMLAISVLPLRLFFILGVIKYGHSKWNFSKKLYQRNVRIGRLFLKHFIQQFYPEYLLNLKNQQIRIYLNKQEMHNFCHKLIQNLQKVLQVTDNIKAFTCLGSIGAIVDHIGNCNFPLFVKNQYQNIYKQGLDPGDFKRKKPNKMINFIKNVPSQRYESIHMASKG